VVLARFPDESRAAMLITKVALRLRFSALRAFFESLSRIFFLAPPASFAPVFEAPLTFGPFDWTETLRGPRGASAPPRP
jgi:hypothetical protein